MCKFKRVLTVFMACGTSGLADARQIGGILLIDKESSAESYGTR
jgi:hypothetical protein